MRAKSVGESLLYDLKQDMRLILSYEGRAFTFKHILWAMFACDAYLVIASFRLRKWARTYRVLGLNRILRFLQTACYGIELGNDIQLGHGVYFVHTLGTIVGGDAKIAEGCIFLGNITVGAARFRGCPQIGAFTVLGSGSRILGKIKIGEHCFIGANAVVLDDIPHHQLAVGIPAQIVKENNDSPEVKRMQHALHPSPLQRVS